MAGDAIAPHGFLPASDQVPVSGLARLLHQRLAAKCTNLPTAFDLILPDGTARRFGNGSCAFKFLLRNRRSVLAFASLDERRLAEAYFNGDFDIEGEMLSVFWLRNRVLTDRHPLLTLWQLVEPLLKGQTRLNKQAISVHYDRDASFFLQFLDPKMPLYTQGIYERDDEPLTDACLRKLSYCFERCRLKAGDHILEIGPGWGSWFKYASERGVRCTGLSISRASIAYLEETAQAEGYDWELIFADILEYQTERKYDAIIMMGVIEHLPQYEKVLAKFVSLLKPGGRIFLDGSSTASKKDVNSVVVKHIYPGNHSLLVLHELLAAMAQTSLQLVELFDDRHSYYLTFRQWAHNWEKNHESVVERFGEAEYRKFLLYLWGFAHNMRTAASGCYRMIFELPSGESAFP
ncbi:class I SAM-dependent methyltransferase [Sabulicella rubraurantiaca]|uniref:class I SAM-dependent methyltransferase n=1 Tax=Sabulicella rubraurantiaca TaxID=2811429 RepID=UPI001A978437|nr:class I SAM-dependent methyltransferase [Sabulicella rubraurantiaca]